MSQIPGVLNNKAGSTWYLALPKPLIFAFIMWSVWSPMTIQIPYDAWKTHSAIICPVTACNDNSQQIQAAHLAGKLLLLQMCVAACNLTCVEYWPSSIQVEFLAPVTSLIIINKALLSPVYTTIHTRYYSINCYSISINLNLGQVETVVRAYSTMLAGNYAAHICILKL